MLLSQGWSFAACAPPSAAAFKKKYLNGFCGIGVLWNKACCGIKHAVEESTLLSRASGKERFAYLKRGR